MYALAFALLCLSYAGHGRRLQQTVRQIPEVDQVSSDFLKQEYVAALRPMARTHQSLQHRARHVDLREGGPTGKPIFYDMEHSNNAARVRLWLALKGLDGGGKRSRAQILTKKLKYSDLKAPWFQKINPLCKVPALVRADGTTVFESYVILDYLEDKYSTVEPSFKPSTPEGRQVMELIIRCHDMYVASPNCCAPGHSHSQGAMYLSYDWHGPSRAMDLKTRADKIGEIWKQLTWLNENMVGPYLAGDSITLADMTWFPTTIFMEFMLPRFFGWPDVFRDTDGPFPRLAKWWTMISEEYEFKRVRNTIYAYWEQQEEKGQFKPIIEEIAGDTDGLKFKYP